MSSNKWSKKVMLQRLNRMAYYLSAEGRADFIEHYGIDENCFYPEALGVITAEIQLLAEEGDLIKVIDKYK